MEFLIKLTPGGGWFRGNEFASKNIDGPNRGEEQFVARPRTSIKAEASETDQTADEREAKLTIWMEEVKSFIRNIDVNNL